MNLMLLIIGMLVGLVLLIFQYKKLVRFKNKVEEDWNSLEMKLKHRYDLLPELMETVRSHAKKEKAVFEKIATAYDQATAAINVTDQTSAESILSQSLKSLFAISEGYPNLKSSEKFRNYQQQLSDVEDEIQIARRNYNATVLENNTHVESFPAILFAGPMGFGKFEYFEMDYAEKEVSKVKF